MHMILGTTHHQGGRFQVVTRPSQVGVKCFAERGFLQVRLAMFRREHNVGIELNEGLRHRSCSRCVTPSAYGMGFGALPRVRRDGRLRRAHAATLIVVPEPSGNPRVSAAGAIPQLRAADARTRDQVVANSPQIWILDGEGTHRPATN